MIITGMMEELAYVVRSEHGLTALAEFQKEPNRRRSIKI